jgi:predicted small secreted protein
MNKLALTLKYLLVYLAVSSFLALAGCNTYVAGMRWHHLDVIVAAPPPQPYPYPY